MSSEPESSGAVAASRARIISRAQERCHVARMRFIEASNSLREGEQGEVAAAELHNAVIDYFYALRAMKDESAVAKFWDEVVLWEQRGGDGETEPVTGFDRLEQEAIQFQVYREQKDGYMGKRTETTKEPVRLPPGVLLRVSAKLDRAAGKLGFTPNADQDVIDTILEQETDETAAEEAAGDGSDAADADGGEEAGGDE